MADGCLLAQPWHAGGPPTTGASTTVPLTTSPHSCLPYSSACNVAAVIVSRILLETVGSCIASSRPVKPRRYHQYCRFGAKAILKKHLTRRQWPTRHPHVSARPVLGAAGTSLEYVLRRSTNSGETMKLTAVESATPTGPVPFAHGRVPRASSVTV